MIRHSPQYSIAAKKRMSKVPKRVLKARMTKLAEIKNSKMTKKQRSEHARMMAHKRVYKKSNDTD